MKLKEIHRTSTFAWSPHSTVPLLATGTVAGALDESFSSESQLEIWAPNYIDRREYELGGDGQVGPKGFITTSSRFNRIAWGVGDGSRPQGVLAAGMENGELGIWDPARIVAHADPSEALIFKNNTHTGPVRGIDFNPVQNNLFASGGVNGEIYIWNLTDPSKPYSPGTRSAKLDEISSLAWNNQVAHILASSSSSGYTVVWDLRHKREVVALTYGAGAGPVVGGIQGGGMGFGARRGMSDVAWHPENATRLVTSSEDDASPVIMVWDLRNARAPEKILTGHEKGVLSLSWCKQDPDLLLSSGKDNRALCWNPQTSEIIGELPSANNWAFQVQWCPRNPDLLATAFFDGTIGIHSIQSPTDPQAAPIAAAPRADGADVFDNPDFARTTQATFSLKQPPKWLRRPVSASFGYGGQLISVSNLPSVQGTHQSSTVHLRKVVTEEEVVKRAMLLREADNSSSLAALAEIRVTEAETRGEESAGWRALASLFSADSRDELITLLGFSKAEIALKVAEAVETLKAAAGSPIPEDNDSTPPKSPVEPDHDQLKPHEPVVSFVEPEEDSIDSAGIIEATPSEVSASATSDTTGVTPATDSESTTTAPPSLFGDDNGAGTPQIDAAADFFTTMGLAPSASHDPVIPHTNYGLDSSVAATIGSGPSSVASESLKSNTFRIYPSDESKTDRLVTKALVVGDFESAVSLCLSSDRFADAILLAVKGGPDLLARTQKAYFERRTAETPYLRLFQSVVTNDLADIVQNADLAEWQEIFVVICTFASQEEFASLAEQLGARLEFQAALAKSAVDRVAYFRKNALLTYLAAGRLERLVNIWTEELAEDEAALRTSESSSLYAAHAHALQAFVEKVTIFRAATSYVDEDLRTREPDASFRLANLYDRYFEYADLLATQGRVQDALFYLKLTPESYTGASGSRLDLASGRERLMVAAGMSKASAPVASTSKATTAPTSRAPAAPANAYGTFAGFAPVQQAPYGTPVQQPAYSIPNQPPYGTSVQQQPAPNTLYNGAATTNAPPPAGPYSRPAPFSQPYGAAQPVSQPYVAQPPMKYPSPYGPSDKSTPLAQHAILPPTTAQATIPLPPRPMSGTGAQLPPPPPPAAFKRDNGGWNDAPAVADRRTPGTVGKPNAITSPFPASQNSPLMSPTYLPRGASPAPPPPRPGSVTNRGAPVPPPPHAGQRASTQPGFTLGSQSGFLPPVPQGEPSHDSIPPPQTSPPRQSGTFSPPQRGHVAPGAGPYANPQPAPGPAPPRGAALATQPPLPGPYAPPQGQHGVPRLGPPPVQSGVPLPPPPPPPPHPSGHVGQPPATQPLPRAAPPPALAGPKYPQGDRSHVPDSLRPIYETIVGILSQLRQNFPQQKRLLDDVEKRLNPLFDALNCETLPANVVEKLQDMTQAMRSGDKQTALEVHVDMLTGTMGANISGWMSGLKQLIQRM